jgi:single-strand DNA-binding protein
MRHLNEVKILGNLGRKPELKYTGTGTPVAVLSVATNDKYRDKQGQEKQTTEWHRVVVWQKLAEAAVKYLDKGAAVLVMGKLHNRKWDDHGSTRNVTEVLGLDLIFLSPQKDTAPANYHQTEEISNEDIPF